MCEDEGESTKLFIPFLSDLNPQFPPKYLLYYNKQTVKNRNSILLVRNIKF